MKKPFTLVATLTALLVSIGCGQQKTDRTRQIEAQKSEPVEVPVRGGHARAYFASGCFWCVEAVYESVEGVKEAVSGYSGGHTENPTYESTNTGTTGHAEAVEVIYDPEKVSFARLVDVYFASHDVTQVNGQGPDRGSQYRSIIFYQNAGQKKIIEEKIAALNGKITPKEVAAEVYPFQKFWVAEAYHQDFEANNPDNGYIRGVSLPRLRRFQETIKAYEDAKE